MQSAGCRVQGAECRVQGVGCSVGVSTLAAGHRFHPLNHCPPAPGYQTLRVDWGSLECRRVHCFESNICALAAIDSWTITPFLGTYTHFTPLFIPEIAYSPLSLALEALRLLQKLSWSEIRVAGHSAGR